MMNEEILSTKRFFDSHNIILSDYWLESCIQWYREENPNSSYTKETLHLKVYEQWLLLDLREVEVPVLPPNLTEQKKMILHGIFSLQMLLVVDISRPKLWQLQKLRNSNILTRTTLDQENINSGSRVLQLVLTDGVQEIEAVEYKPISVLNVNLAPGIKIRITGPIMVRRGQLLLEEKHIKILGGEVEELLVSNAAENVLARALNLRQNPSPHIIEETFATANMDVVESVKNVTGDTQNWKNNVQSSISDNRIFKDVKSVGSDCISKIGSSAHKKENMAVNRVNAVSPVEEEEMRIMAEVDMLLEAERDISEEHNKPSKSNNLDISGNNCVSTDVITKAENTENVNRCITQEIFTANDNTKKESADDYTNIFENMDIDAHLDFIDDQLAQKTQKDLKGVVTIEELCRNRTSITSGKFTVKAKFKKVVQKLTVANDAWFLKLLIEDETSDLEAFLHSDIISNLMGYCPSAVMALKKDIVNKDECATATVMKAIEGLKTKIMTLDCMMVVTFAPGEDCPTITDLKYKL